MTKTSDPPKVQCTVCKRSTAPKTADGGWATWECSHVDCPHRRSSWSERPAPMPPAPDGVFNPYAKLIPEEP